jgi:hypothetical protein
VWISVKEMHSKATGFPGAPAGSGLILNDPVAPPPGRRSTFHEQPGQRCAEFHGWCCAVGGPAAAADARGRGPGGAGG